jgi:hypothetical protein
MYVGHVVKQNTTGRSQARVYVAKQRAKHALQAHMWPSEADIAAHRRTCVKPTHTSEYKQKCAYNYMPIDWRPHCRQTSGAHAHAKEAHKARVQTKARFQRRGPGGPIRARAPEPESNPRTAGPDWLWTREPEPSPRTGPIGFGPQSPSPRAGPIGFGPGSPSPGTLLRSIDSIGPPRCTSKKPIASCA